MSGKEDEADAVLAHRRRHFNSLAVVTRGSASVIKKLIMMDLKEGNL